MYFICKTSYNVLSHSIGGWDNLVGEGQRGEGVVKKRESPDLSSPVVGISAIVKYRMQHGFLLHTKNDRF